MALGRQWPSTHSLHALFNLLFSKVSDQKYEMQMICRSKLNNTKYSCLPFCCCELSNSPLKLLSQNFFAKQFRSKNVVGSQSKKINPLQATIAMLLAFQLFHYCINQDSRSKNVNLRVLFVMSSCNVSLMVSRFTVFRMEKTAIQK